jgi:hypothetical protein
VFLGLSDEQLSALLDKLNWLLFEGVKAPLVTCFEQKGIVWLLPKRLFEDGTAIEFAMADQFLDAFNKSGNETDLLKLVGSLATPLSKNAGSSRVVICNREEAEHRADVLRGIPMETAMAVLLYFVGTKAFISEQYGKFLFDDDEDDEQDDAIVRSATAHFPNFGWWGAYLGIAESGVFGNYEQVLHTNFHRVAMFLIEKRREHRRMKASMNSKKTA